MSERVFFFDVTARMPCFFAARQLSTDLESLEISCRPENSRSHIFVFCRDSFQCSGMRTVARLFLRVSSISALGSRRDRSFWMLCLKTFHHGTVCVCLAWSSPLPRYCCCVDCLYCDLDTRYFIIFFIVELETGGSQDLKYAVNRITSLSSD